MELGFRQESNEIVGPFFGDCNELGPGFPEDVYQDALETELDLRGLPFNSKPKFEIRCKGKLPTKEYERIAR